MPTPRLRPTTDRELLEMSRQLLKQTTLLSMRSAVSRRATYEQIAKARNVLHVAVLRKSLYEALTRRRSWTGVAA